MPFPIDRDDFSSEIKDRDISTRSGINANVLSCSYAVRCELVEKAHSYRSQLISSPSSLPFDEIIPCNIGNPHALGQSPITYIRQVLSLCCYPPLLSSGLFPVEIVTMAQQYIDSIPGGIGAYSHSQGVEYVRDQISSFVNQRDATSSVSASDIILCKGASEAVKHVLMCLLRNEKDGILLPSPQYPLYSSTITVLGGQYIDYVWKKTPLELENQLHELYETSIEKNINLRALVVINPDNPTGKCLSNDQVETLLNFCQSHHLVLLADEVYQENIYTSTDEFTSFYKIALTSTPRVKLISFHSVSKGFVGECGMRAGYMHCFNIPQLFKDQLLKLQSTSLCSNVLGQIALGCSLTPPPVGTPSYALYLKEKQMILSSHSERSQYLVKKLNEIERIECQPIQGALYAFPQIHIPQRLMDVAFEEERSPDWVFCKALLDETGILAVPGSGFGQQDGEWHIRLTILPEMKKLEKLVHLLNKFMTQFECYSVDGRLISSWSVSLEAIGRVRKFVEGERDWSLYPT